MRFSGLCTYYFRTKFSTKAVLQYRKTAYHYLSKKKVTEFYGQNTAVYLSALNTDLQKIKEDFLDQIPILSQIVICGIGAVLVMIRYNLFLAVMACLISLIPFFAALFSGRNMEKIEENLSKENAEYLAFLKDFAIGFTIIKSYKVEGIFSALHDKICQVWKSGKNAWRKSITLPLFPAISPSLPFCSYALLWPIEAKAFPWEPCWLFPD